jgi:hypothetical protein
MPETTGAESPKKRSYIKRGDLFKFVAVVNALKADADRDGGWPSAEWLARVRSEMAGAGVDFSYAQDTAVVRNLQQAGVTFARPKKAPRAKAKAASAPKATSKVGRVLAVQLRHLAQLVQELCEELGVEFDPKVDIKLLTDISRGQALPDHPEGGPCPSGAGGA